MKPRDWDAEIILDHAHIRGFTLGDRALEAEVMDIFLTQMPDYMQALAEASSADWADSAHKIKGAARGIGAWHLADAAADCEELPVDRCRRADCRQHCLAVLQQRFDLTRAHIDAYLERTD